MIKRIMDAELKQVYLKCWWCGQKAELYFIQMDERDKNKAICFHCHGSHHTSDALDNEEIDFIGELDYDEPVDIKRIDGMWESHVKKYGEEECLK